jgi:alpha-D-xyloside xylohydrolase
MKITILSLCVCLFTINFALGDPLPVQSIHQDASGATLQLQTGGLRVQVCDDSLIRITYSPTGKFSDQTQFIVNHTWAPAPFKLMEDAKGVTVGTARMKAFVDRATAAVTFTDAQGNLLLQEPLDGGKVAMPVTVNREQTYRVQQTFLSPEDEHLYGMAEGQDGTWNWRGMPIELRQLNTQAALPFLISTRGYGLLWNSAALTDFNPVDDAVPLTPLDGAATYTTGPTATEQLHATTRKAPEKLANRTGTFISGDAGTYVFFARDGDRRAELGIEINGKSIAHLHNMWVPYTITGTIDLPAHTRCGVRLIGGGKDARLFARPLGNTTTFRSQVGDCIDYYFFFGPEIGDIISHYRTATGAAPLWPKWAYGFWQCRERYSSQQQILDTVAEFRKRQIPIDLIVQDWKYWGNHGWGAYQWDASNYPDPRQMIQSLHDQHVRFMISIWSNPHGTAGDDLAQHSGLIPTTPWVDAFNPAARDIRWKHILDAFFKIGTDAWWQDATEPGDDGNSMAGHQVFLGSGDLYRNAYPLFANQTVYEGQRATDPNKRVCILTRSAFPGQQRYGSALWSGDIAGDWETLRRQIPAGLNVCLTGVPYWTTDCGGFFRPRDQFQSKDYADLLIRWFQFSTFCPIQRIHGYQTSTEFWNYPLALQTLTSYDQFRHRLLPYIYSMVWRITHDGDTLTRALPIDFRNDAKVFNIADEYMFGPSILVAPVTSAGATSRSVYLPAGTSWINFWTGETLPGGQTITAAAPQEIIPLFLRAGSILPMGPEMQYVDEKPTDPMELRIYPGADGSFTLYEDEGDSYRYESGTYATVPITWKESTHTLTLGPRHGEFPGMLKERAFRITFVRPGKGIGMAAENQADVELRYSGESEEIQAATHWQ